MNNQNIKLALREALNSNATPKEIYDEIVNILESEVKEGKRAADLLLLVKGNLSALYSTNEETAYWNGELEGEKSLRKLWKSMVMNILLFIHNQNLHLMKWQQQDMK